MSEAKSTTGSDDRTSNDGHVLRTILAFLSPLLALLVQWAWWDFIRPYVWFLFYPAIFLSTWIGGLRAGVIATVLATASAWWVLVPPMYTFEKETRQLFPAAVFFCMGLLFVAFQERLRRAHQRAEAALVAAQHTNEVLQRTLDERRLLAALIDNSSDFIGLADAQGKPVYVNPAGRRMVGLGPDQPIGDTQISDYYPPELRSFVSDEIVKAMLEKGRWQGETYFRHWQTQAAIPVSDEHFMIRDSDMGRVLGMGTVTRDVSELRRARDEAEAAHRKLQQANAELTRMYEKAKELDQLKTQLFANVSHELRTPLTLVLGPVERLLDAPAMPEPARRDLQVIARNARTLLRHINDLLDVAKLEVSGVEVDYAETDVTRLARFVASHFEVLAQERHITYTLEIPEALSAQIDPDKLQHVLLNLLSNAFKFTPDGGRVRVTARVANEQLHVEVADSGPGIPPEKRKAVFERFRQLEGGTTRRFGGTGLGLSIAQGLVALHRGTLAVNDAPEGGALFVVTLPREAPAGSEVRAQPVEALAEEEIRQTVAELRGRPPAVRPATTSVSDGRSLVLVVEDNPEMNRFICENLASSYRVAAAFDGREGLQKTLELKPDLVLSDMMMPELSGEELLRAIRSQPALERTAFVLLTAKADDELRVRLLRAGAQDYLTKPFSVQELHSRIDNLIAAKQVVEIESRLASLVAQAPDGIFVADREGRCIEVNAAGCRMLALSREQILGHPIWERLLSEPCEQLAAVRERLLRGENVVGEGLVLRADGARLPVEVSATTLSDGRWQAFVRDISERKAAAEAIAASEAKFRQIVSGAAEAIISIDEEHRIVLFNEGAERIFGWTAAEVMNRPLEMLLPERYRAIHLEHVRAFAKSGVRARPMAARRPIPALRRNGEEFPAQASILQLVEGGRRVFTTVLRDISYEVRILEEEQFLREIGTVLASSLDVEVTLSELSRRAVRYLGDLCIIELAFDGAPRRAASRDPERAWLAEALQDFPLDRARPFLGADVWQTQQPLLVADMGPFLETHTQSPEHLALVQAWKPRSLLAVPMLTSGRLLGVLILLSSRRTYDRHDLHLAAEIAGRAATALDNASLHAALLRANDDIRARLRELQEAQEKIRTLTGLLPVCAWCGRVRDEDAGGAWKGLDQYVAEHSSAQVSHGICPDCMAKSF